MATKNTQARAGKTASAAKSTARKASGTSTQARRTTKQATRTTKEAARTTQRAERTAVAVARDGVYAVLGVGDSAVGLLRSLPRRAGQVRTGVPRTVEAVPGEVRAAIGGLVSSAGRGFDTYARRGRAVTRSIAGSRPTRRAVEQTKVARSQVKGATTSVRRAVDEGVGAAGAAAGKVGDDQRG